MLCGCKTGIGHDWVYCDTRVGNMYTKYDLYIFLNFQNKGFESIHVYDFNWLLTEAKEQCACLLKVVFWHHNCREEKIPEKVLGITVGVLIAVIFGVLCAFRTRQALRRKRKLNVDECIVLF